MPAFGTVVWVLAAIMMFLAIWKTGIALTRGLTSPLPEPPPQGELRRVSVRYRCTVCGLELRMTLAPEEDPPPPRHCMEEMELVAPIE